MNFIEEKRRGEGKGEGGRGGEGRGREGSGGEGRGGEGRGGEGRGGEEGVKLTKTMQFYHLLIFINHLFFIMIDYRVSFIKNFR